MLKFYQIITKDEHLTDVPGAHFKKRVNSHFLQRTNSLVLPPYFMKIRFISYSHLIICLTHIYDITYYYFCNATPKLPSIILTLRKAYSHRLFLSLSSFDLLLLFSVFSLCRHFITFSYNCKLILLFKISFGNYVNFQKRLYFYVNLYYNINVKVCIQYQITLVLSKLTSIKFDSC